MMRIINGTISRARALGKQKEFSLEGMKGLAWFDYYEGHGQNASLTCRHYWICQQAFCKWNRRYDPRRLDSLQDRSRRLRKIRRPTLSRELVQAVIEMREEKPRWGKDKLGVLLRGMSRKVSTSMMGWVLKVLKERGVLIELSINGISARKKMRKRPYAVHKPKG